MTSLKILISKLKKREIQTLDFIVRVYYFYSFIEAKVKRPLLEKD
jgi:hypothetical protein